MNQDRESLVSQIRALQRMLSSGPAGSQCDEWAAMIDKIFSGEYGPPSNKDLAGHLADLQKTFDGMEPECRDAILHGWSEWRDRPGRRDVRAARQLHELRRVLAITATERSVSAEQQVIYSDGDPLVRIEIREGATQAQVIKSLVRTIGPLLLCWRLMIDHKTADQVKLFDRAASPGEGSNKAPSKAV